MSYYRILSIDGGGIRGVLTAVMLQRLEDAAPGFLSKVDLFAGTSTGGLLALTLASGKTPAEARQLYEQKGKVVFADSLLDEVRDLGNLIGAKFSNHGLIYELEQLFGERTLADLPKRVVITSFDLDSNPADPAILRTWKPKFFHNFPGPESDGAQKIVDVGVRTASAPSYFPIYQGYIDGGVAANNPSMCALAQALDANTGAQKASQVVMFSVSTGRTSQYLDSQDGDWGITQWAKPLIDILLGGSAGVAHYQCSRILGKRYLRLDPILPEAISLSDVAKVPELVSIAGQVDLTDTVKWLKHYFA